MSSLIDQLINCAKTQYCFVQYLYDEKIVLQIPFYLKDHIIIKDNFIEGFDFIKNKKIRLFKNKIQGFIYVENGNPEHEKDLKYKLNLINNKKLLIDKLKKEYHIKYDHDEEYILYCPYENSIYMYIFNFKDINDLKNKNTKLYIDKFKKLILMAANRSEDKLLECLKHFDKNKDIVKTQIKLIKEKIKISINKKINAETVEELIKYNWPKILMPNPFLSLDFLKK